MELVDCFSRSHRILWQTLLSLGKKWLKTGTPLLSTDETYYQNLNFNNMLIFASSAGSEKFGTLESDLLHSLLIFLCSSF